jgi:hypothetical protein
VGKPILLLGWRGSPMLLQILDCGNNFSHSLYVPVESFGYHFWRYTLAKPDNHLYFLYLLKLYAYGILKILTVMSKNRQVPFILSAPSRLSF